MANFDLSPGLSLAFDNVGTIDLASGISPRAGLALRAICEYIPRRPDDVFALLDVAGALLITWSPDAVPSLLAGVAYLGEGDMDSAICALVESVQHSRAAGGNLIPERLILNVCAGFVHSVSNFLPILPWEAPTLAVA